jgi:hypothetical protein
LHEAGAGGSLASSSKLSSELPQMGKVSVSDLARSGVVPPRKSRAEHEVSPISHLRYCMLSLDGLFNPWCHDPEGCHGETFAMPRLRLRSLMVLVALTAVATAWIVKPWFWDRPRWIRLGRYHEGQAAMYLRRAEKEGSGNPVTYEQLLDRWRWHRSRAAKYFRAYAYPDIPPPPESLPPWEGEGKEGG